MDLIETNSNYIFTLGTRALFCDRLTGKFRIEHASEISKEWNPLCLGKVDGIIGKLRYYEESCWRLFVIRSSEYVGCLPDGLPVRRITQIISLTVNTTPTTDFLLEPCRLDHPGIRKLCYPSDGCPTSPVCSKLADNGSGKTAARTSTGTTSATTTSSGADASASIQSKPLILHSVHRKLRGVARAVTGNQSTHRKRDRYEQRIHEELTRMFDSNQDGLHFYFSPGGGDLTSWTQRRAGGSLYWAGRSGTWADESCSAQSLLLDSCDGQCTAWRQPVWRRADQQFFWNSHMLSEAIEDADRQLTRMGLPDYASEEALETGPATETTDRVNQTVLEMESLLVPIVHGFVEFQRCPLSELSKETLTTGSTTVTLATSPKRTLPTSPPTATAALSVTYACPGSSSDDVTREGGSVTIHGLCSERTVDLSGKISSEGTGHSNDATTGCPQAHRRRTGLTTVPDKEITLILFSRRSRFRAGTQYRRRGIDEDGQTANYVETEQIVHMHTENGVPQTVAFLQSRGSVPLFWSQTGLKYKPPINLERDDAENRAAFARHWERLLTRFQKVVIVNLLDSGSKRFEERLCWAYTQHLLAYNHPQLITVLFDFHEYCRGLHFENASILLLNTMDLLREMAFNWICGVTILSKQRWIFRHNCLDCLDRTNVVQCMFATAVVAIQLKKFAIIDPEDSLPYRLNKVMQHMWADNGDAISQQYAGTVAMKNDFTRTGERTMNGLVRDGVSSVNRYYLRFRELLRQAAIDLLLGNETSSELALIRSGAGVESASMQAWEDRVKTLISRCKQMVLGKDELSLSECLLIYYSELTLDVQLATVIALVTDRYLHFIRIDSPKRLGRPLYVRIPSESVEKLELGLEPSIFRANRYVIRVYYRPPTEDRSEEQTISTSVTCDSPGADSVPAGSSSPRVSVSDVLCPGESEQPITVTNSSSSTTLDVWTSPDKADPPADPQGLSDSKSSQHETAESREKKAASRQQHFLTFMQPDVRLFNTTLMPVPPGDEKLQSLRVVAATLLSSVQLNKKSRYYQSADGLQPYELPTGKKLARLRQAAVPKAYQPTGLLDVDRMFEGMRKSRPTHSRRSSTNSHHGKEGNTSVKGNKANVSFFPSRNNRLYEKLSQIKIPNLRLRTANRTKGSGPSPTGTDEGQTSFTGELDSGTPSMDTVSGSSSIEQQQGGAGESSPTGDLNAEEGDSDTTSSLTNVEEDDDSEDDDEVEEEDSDEDEEGDPERRKLASTSVGRGGEHSGCPADALASSLSRLVSLTGMAVDREPKSGEAEAETSPVTSLHMIPTRLLEHKSQSLLNVTTDDVDQEASHPRTASDAQMDQRERPRRTQSVERPGQPWRSRIVRRQQLDGELPAWGRPCPASNHPILPMIALPGNKQKSTGQLREKRLVFIRAFEKLRQSVSMEKPVQTTFIIF